MDVTLTRSGPLVRLSPWVTDIEPLLSYDYSSFDGSSHETKILYHLVDGAGYFPSGFQKTVRETLARMGHRTEFIDERDRARLYQPFQWELVSELRSGQKEVLESILAHDHGVVVCATGFGKSFLIGELVRGMPNSRFIISAPGISETRNLHDRLKGIVPPEELSMLGAGSKDSPDRRVVVTTSKSAYKADFLKADFFLCDEVHMCGHNMFSTMLMANLGDSRNYGFTATPKGRSDRSDRIIEAIFGPQIATFNYSDCVASGNVVPIDVVFWQVPGDIPSTDSRYGSKMVINKRRFYWRNEVRNLTVATVARDLPDDEQVLIMVENIDHMLHLAELLPDYTLVYGAGNDLEARARSLRKRIDNPHTDTPEKFEQIYRGFKEGSVRKVISTGVYKQGVDFPQLSVLVRADGSPSPIASIQIPGRISRLSKDKNRAVLYDFRDTFNKTALNNFYARRRHYLAAGWTVTYKDILEET